MSNLETTKTILLIEDDAGIAALVLEALGESGWSAAHVANGRAAIQWLAVQRPELVLLDYSLPDMTGLELVQHVSKTPAGMPPFMVTTGAGDERVAVTMMKNGARDYLVKDHNFLDNLPVIVAHVLGEVALASRLEEAQQALRASEAKLRAIFELLPVGISVLDDAGNIVETNPMLEKIVGLQRPALLRGDHRQRQYLHVDGTVMPPEEFASARSRREHAVVSNVETGIALEDGRVLWTNVSAAPVDIADWKTVIVTSDITHRKLMEQELRQHEQNLQALIENADGSIWSVDTRYRLIVGNLLFRGNTAKAIGRPLLTGDNVLDLPLPADVLQEWRGYYDRALAGERFTIETTTRFTPAPLTMEYHFNPIRSADGAISGVTIFGRDISERKQAEVTLRAALHEKEVLLRELYHRTKNNMQVISAMLDLEAEQSDDPTLQKTLLDMENRIRSMALVHQKLYQSKSLSSIDLAEYIADLAHLLVKTYTASATDIALQLDLPPAPAVIDIAMPCGLIINEVISNALKYAFPGRPTGEIRVALRSDENGLLQLEIADNGVGLPPGFDARQCKSLGMQTIFGLAEHQLGARVEIASEQGLTWRFFFLKRAYPSRSSWSEE